MIKLIFSPPSKTYNPIYDFTSGFEHSILRDKNVKRVRRFFKNKVFRAILSNVFYFSSKVGLNITRKSNAHLRGNKFEKISFTIQGGITHNSFFYDHCFSPNKKAIYFFDLWPASHQIAIDYIKYFHLDYVFISSSVVVQKFNHLMRDKKCYWIPEGINPDEYKFYPVEQRNIDVLAFGRKYQKYHEAIVNNLKEKRYNYLYEKNSGGLVFATKHEFIEGLARSKVSICVPHSLTNPDKAEDVETMTIRYLQSMASKCLIVGHAPAEMIELFGYNPVIEIDMNDPVNQLEHILENYLTYSGFIEKNYNEVIKNNTWMNRWNQIKSILLEKNN